MLSLNLWSTQRSTIKSTICTGILFLQTDDKGVFSTSLSEEYQLAAVTFDLSPNDLWRLSQDSINYAFCEEHLKEKLKEKWKAAKPGMEKQFNFKFWTLLCCWIFCNVRWETTNKSVKRKKKPDTQQVFWLSETWEGKKIRSLLGGIWVWFLSLKHFLCLYCVWTYSESVFTVMFWTQGLCCRIVKFFIICSQGKIIKISNLKCIFVYCIKNIHRNPLFQSC